MRDVRLIFLISLFLQVFVAKAQNPYEVSIPLGQTVTLSVSPNSDYSYQWYRDGRAMPNENRPTLIVGAAGRYQVSAINSGNCESDLSDVFTVIVEYSDLEIIKKSESRAVGPNETFEYTLQVLNRGVSRNPNVTVSDPFPPNLRFVEMGRASQGIPSYAAGVVTWNIGALNKDESAYLVIKAQGKAEGNISNTASVAGDPSLPDPNSANNTSTDIKKIVGNIKVPNVITPNGDGKNDVLKIEGIELYKENSLSIFNRWGNEVYRSPGGYQNNWSGEGLSEGTYYYVLKLVSKEGVSSSVTGWVTLLRDK